MSQQPRRLPRHVVNRRAFLTGVGTVAVGLPFLEGLPGRSAWAQDAPPVFSFFIVAQNGVVQDMFWPTSTGALSAGTMAGKAVEKLSAHAANLLIVKGIKAPGGNPGACGHAQGCVQAITGIAPGSTGNSSTSGGPSADMVISKALNPQGTDPLTLYSGQQKGAFIAERTSFTGGMTPARAAQLNPYETYKKLTGLLGTGGGTTVPTTPGTGTPPTGPSAADELLIRQKSVNDLVRDSFATLISNNSLSSLDKQRLTSHMEGIRQLELNMMSTGDNMNEMNADNPDPVTGAGCTAGSLNQTALDAYKNGIQFNTKGHMIEDIVKLHGETVALAFACNANRTATLQWGDGTDGTVYTTKATGGYNTFHKISHRTNSDATAGNDGWAKEAHAEIDQIRMETLAHVIQAFKDRGLLEQSFIYWTSSISDGPSHAFNPLPIVIAGNGGGFLKQGQYIDANGSTNAKILASLITAAGVPTDNFGAGGGQLTAIHA
jgi:Protein of unknown function (DUF1552)